jgi:large conductance mechanosensitive channel
MSAISEFKTFAMRGNMIDLAVGVVIGAAFTTIINSLVADILTPPLGLLFGNVDFKDFFLVLRGPAGVYPTLAAAKAAGAVTLNYGLFFNAIINFVIVAIALFMLIRWINRLTQPAPAGAVAAAPPPEDIVLLRDIRDALRART